MLQHDVTFKYEFNFLTQQEKTLSRSAADHCNNIFSFNRDHWPDVDLRSWLK